LSENEEKELIQLFPWAFDEMKVLSKNTYEPEEEKIDYQ
jgi:hypothetical protein